MSQGIGMISVVNGLTVGGASNEATVRAPSSTSVADPRHVTGSEVQLDDGRCVMYVKFNEAFAIGQTATFLADVAVTNATAAASDNTFTKTAAFTADRYNDPNDQWYITITGGTGLGQTRKIISNTANVLTLDTAWLTAIDTTSDATVFSTSVVELSDAANEKIVGVALSAISAGQYGWIQTKGLCPLIRFAGDTDAAVAHEGIVSSGAAGVAKGLTAAGTTSDEAEKAFATALYAYAGADAAGAGIAAILK